MANQIMHDEVTAIGQSVGANDVSFQLLAFGGIYEAPFQQAVLMSGGPGMNFNSDPNLVDDNTAAIAQEVGFDGDFFPDRPSKLLRAGKLAKGIPVIASWVTNDGAWYPPPSVSTDEGVLASLGVWLTGLSESTKGKLLELYPLEDFESMVRPDHDGPISPQYFRAAQINRDFWFTCPALGFAWQYARNGGGDTSQIRLYEHNATRYTPVFENMGVPMWRVAHLSDIPYVLNSQRLGGGADNSAAQLKLAKIISRSIMQFITSGSPVLDVSGGLEAWPAAFENVTKDELEHDFPGKVSLALFDRKHLGEPVTVSKTDDQTTATGPERAVGWEKLFERCGFINSQSVVDEVGW
ncbi:putative carboxylesterase family protein [Eutypa lata UCREL1]|uniref:Putative carboxylesterase family protein n=1 Tax=Eutypa lata (strain UCR-EL1) TaxID=1287681 RepID=M7T5M8_EUTLA|nr:putative carboxylesterase family protein [Eutypa lata UCREL1]